MRFVQDSTVNFVAQWEGFRATAYLDYSQYSIGYGSGKMPDGRTVRPGDTITEPEARKLLRTLLIDYATVVQSSVTSAINQNQFDALVSLCYNIGKAGFLRSSVLKRVNENPNNFEAIEAAFKMWNTAGGAVNSGLVKRRQAEADLYKKSPAGGLFFFVIIAIAFVIGLVKKRKK